MQYSYWVVQNASHPYTFAISYTLVGIIFNALGWFNSKIMSIAYFVISTLLGFALVYVVMLIETKW